MSQHQINEVLGESTTILTFENYGTHLLRGTFTNIWRCRMEDKPMNALLDGSATEDSSPTSPDDRTTMIHRMIEDPDSDPYEVMRLIKLEINTINGHLSRLANDPVGCSSRLRIYDARLKALRQLQRSVTDTEWLRKREMFNLDGEKAKFLIRQ